jgi:hypothetical protein
VKVRFIVDFTLSDDSDKNSGLFEISFFDRVPNQATNIVLEMIDLTDNIKYCAFYTNVLDQGNNQNNNNTARIFIFWFYQYMRTL